jgi:dihydropteroate synthase
VSAKRRPLPLGPAVVGIVNVTPDSFSGDGLCAEPEAAVLHGLRLLADGAVALDIGAESTRPGAAPVDPAEEQRRLLPVLRGLRARTDAPLSVDTRHAGVAEAALREGADIVNDVSMLHDPDMARVAARAGATLVVMHSRGTPLDMAARATYGDVVAEVCEELDGALRRAVAQGVDRDRLVADPGFGFAKTPLQGLELLRRLGELRALAPLLVGLSRKSLAGALISREGVVPPPRERVAASIGLALAAVHLGASWVRVHDVRETAEALRAWTAVVARPAVREEAACQRG